MFRCILIFLQKIKVFLSNIKITIIVLISYKYFLFDIRYYYFEWNHSLWKGIEGEGVKESISWVAAALPAHPQMMPLITGHVVYTFYFIFLFTIARFELSSHYTSYWKLFWQIYIYISPQKEINFVFKWKKCLQIFGKKNLKSFLGLVLVNNLQNPPPPTKRAVLIFWFK